jgi:lipopolysaccharide biosynthesis protein
LSIDEQIITFYNNHTPRTHKTEEASKNATNTQYQYDLLKTKKNHKKQEQQQPTTQRRGRASNKEQVTVLHTSTQRSTQTTAKKNKKIKIFTSYQPRTRIPQRGLKWIGTLREQLKP